MPRTAPQKPRRCRQTRVGLYWDTHHIDTYACMCMREAYAHWVVFEVTRGRRVEGWSSLFERKEDEGAREREQRRKIHLKASFGCFSAIQETQEKVGSSVCGVYGPQAKQVLRSWGKGEERDSCVYRHPRRCISEAALRLFPLSTCIALERNSLGKERKRESACVWKAVC